MLKILEILRATGLGGRNELGYSSKNIGNLNAFGILAGLNVLEENAQNIGDIKSYGLLGEKNNFGIYFFKPSSTW